jgi:hypothetical protein
MPTEGGLEAFGLGFSFLPLAFTWGFLPLVLAWVFPLWALALGFLVWEAFGREKNY